MLNTKPTALLTLDDATHFMSTIGRSGVEMADTQQDYICAIISSSFKLGMSEEQISKNLHVYEDYVHKVLTHVYGDLKDFKYEATVTVEALSRFLFEGYGMYDIARSFKVSVTDLYALAPVRNYNTDTMGLTLGLLLDWVCGKSVSFLSEKWGCEESTVQYVLACAGYASQGENFNLYDANLAISKLALDTEGFAYSRFYPHLPAQKYHVAPARLTKRDMDTLQKMREQYDDKYMSHAVGVSENKFSMFLKEEERLC